MLHKHIISPFLDERDSEAWHGKAVEALHFMENGFFRRRMLMLLGGGRVMRLKDKRLNMQVGHMKLDNPVMVGAGWDKKGRAVRGLHALGFSGVEVGSVLKRKQDGNPKPRQFMVSPGVSLNRLGFNSPGMDEVAKNLERYRHSGIPIGISLGKNKEVPDEDAPEAHADVAARMAGFASYMAINVSSPNTAGLRRLQESGPLTDIVQAVQEKMRRLGYRPDLYVKIAPDLTLEAVDDVIGVAVDNGLTGIIASNTTNRSDLKAKYERDPNELGGISGDDAEFRAMSTRQIAHIYEQTDGALEIIGVGGVKDAETALEKIRAGASAVQVVTAIRGEGANVANNINKAILKILDRDKVDTLAELRGTL